MIFATDLDKTLIYSKNSMDDIVPEEELIPVEENGGAYTSFMTKRAITQLSEIEKSAFIVPVTTRTITQYKRVFYFNKVLNLRYAITTNGGNILIDGSPDEEWSALVQTALRTSADHLEVKAMYDQISSPEWALRGWLCDGLFYTMIIDPEKTPFERLDQFRETIHHMGWVLSVQGRKVYLVPARVTKGEAMLHLSKRLGSKFIAASGDSLLDASLLAIADYAIAPGHGELFGKSSSGFIYQFTQKTGIRASEEILERVHRELQHYLAQNSSAS
ncbi:Hydroxymethylpyrimidine pyrophosphatase [Paenibacillus tianmuensis]|uniref:Hydroxymethylpyrimidine pyrophosphatase n=1 Tax=Paenibacillus tianmuensis TaxID=624147 RepID=A0A1G4QKJ3_9BACL|nr:HAD family hydrolase [Paenibacillus tianmuensis]SCW44599.1 Hydroxymethylpyrimidine pyrophosphatase [Paenibacillus tianmuensis]